MYIKSLNTYILAILFWKVFHILEDFDFIKTITLVVFGQQNIMEFSAKIVWACSLGQQYCYPILDEFALIK